MILNDVIWNLFHTWRVIIQFYVMDQEMRHHQDQNTKRTPF